MTHNDEQTRRALAQAAEALRLIPPNAPAFALMRHAERGKIPQGSAGEEILLTPRGESDSLEMGRLFHGRVSAMRHSPVFRCRQTAEKILENAGGPTPIEWAPLAFHAFVDNEGVAKSTLLRLVTERGFYDRFVSAMSTSAFAPYSGFKRPLAGAVGLAAQMTSDKGVHVNITHDWLVNVTASLVSGRETDRPNYAGFLDALFVWEEDGQTLFYHMGKTGACAPEFQRELDAARGK